MAETEVKTITVRRALDGLGLAPGADAPLVGDRLPRRRGRARQRPALRRRAVGLRRRGGAARGGRRSRDPSAPSPPERQADGRRPARAGRQRELEHRAAVGAFAR